MQKKIVETLYNIYMTIYLMCVAVIRPSAN